MSDGVLTYAALYALLRQEKQKPEIQSLDPAFYNQVIKYFSEKKAILDSQQKKESIFASASVAATRLQIENLQKILKELYERREHKIVQLALLSSRTGGPVVSISGFLSEELEFYKQLVHLLDTCRSGVLAKLLSCEVPSVSFHASLSPVAPLLVRFLYAVPSFVGLDLQVYGPYEAEDVACLPKELTDVLVQRGRAQILLPS